MGIWRDQVVPRVTDLLLDTGEIRRLRRETIAGVRGNVVEIGFGSGLNLPFYSPAVDKVLAIEPSGVAARLAAGRIASAPVPVEVVGLDAQVLPFAGASLDAAVSTFTLCTVPDPRAALHELLRVLRPGGAFHFLEHGRSPSASVARWQHRLDPLQQRLAAGCHLDRPIDRLLEEAGFLPIELRNLQLPGPRAMRPFGYLYLGTAIKPDT
jgi:ubiquinone/menaquinone biosynthesis C-methylase UbiE